MSLPDGAGSTKYTYAKNTVTIEDAAGKWKKYETSSFGQLVKVYEPNPAGGADLVTTYTYNSLGRLLSATNPEMSGAVTYTYFANGALQTRTDARGVTLTNTLDILGRVTRADYSTTDPVTPNLRFCYDGQEYNVVGDNCAAVGGRSDYARGVLTHAVARTSGGSLVSGTRYSNIDPLGRVLESRRTTGPHTDYTFLYQYAVGGALAKMRYPSGNWVSYDINGANRISKVRKGETGTTFYMQNTAYNPAGALTSATLGLDGANQWTETRAYNSRLQARSVQVQKGASTLLRLHWAYAGSYNPTTFEETFTDNNGNPRAERIEYPHQGVPQSIDRTYTYTGANRLLSFTEPSKNQSFQYDAFGNVWQYSASGVPALWQTGAWAYHHAGGIVNNRLKDREYDAAGNQKQLSVSPGTTASYDAENRMTRIVAGTSEIATYTYDAEGRRVMKTVNGTPTYYFYDAFGQLMAEYGNPSQTATTHYFTTDYLGSTRMILGATGNCLERLDYAPFGGQITRIGQECYGSASSEKPLFTGQMRDGESAAGTETGQDYFNARYFWAAVGRFTSPDAPFADQRPEDGQSWNMYAYVRNNPLRYVDPSGRKIELIGDEEARNKALAELRDSVGAEAGKRLVINEVQDGDRIRYFVNVSGEMADFQAMGDAASDLGDFIGAEPVVEYGIVDGDLPGAGRKEAAYTYGPGEIGNANVRILVNPAKVQQADIAFNRNRLLRMKYGSGTLRTMTMGVVTWHELGHTWGMWANIRAKTLGVIPGASEIDVSSGTANRSLDWENRMRRILYGPLGPRNAKRIRH